MRSTKAFLSFLPAAVLATGMVSSGAMAADLLDPPVVEVREVVAPVQGGWYLRGDITYDFQSMDDSPYAYTDQAYKFDKFDIDDAFDLGLGIGYQVNEYFRVDLTGEYVFEADFTGHFNCVQFPVGHPLAGGCPAAGFTTETADVSKFRLLSNAYADLGTFHGVTPYVGAGIGGTYVMVDNYQQNSNGGAAGQSLQHRDWESWRFAYAFHAGFAYSLTHNVKLDFGYSYHGTAGGAFAGYDINNPNTHAQIHDEGFEDHVIRAGIRYSW